MNTFNYSYPVKVYFGEGAAKEKLAGELGKVGEKCAAGIRRRLDKKERYL